MDDMLADTGHRLADTGQGLSDASLADTSLGLGNVSLADKSQGPVDTSLADTSLAGTNQGPVDASPTDKSQQGLGNTNQGPVNTNPTNKDQGLADKNQGLRDASVADKSQGPVDASLADNCQQGLGDASLVDNSQGPVDTNQDDTSSDDDFSSGMCDMVREMGLLPTPRPGEIGLADPYVDPTGEGESATDRLFQLLESFEAAKIILLEWENHLLRRLKYPTFRTADEIFLVADHQLPTACSLVADFRFPRVTKKDRLYRTFVSELYDEAFRYRVDPRGSKWMKSHPRPRVIVLLPLSWAGLTQDDLIPGSGPTDDRPCTTFTLDLPTACSTFLRLVVKEKRGGNRRWDDWSSQFGCIIVYSLLDMSYEGDYFPYPDADEPLSEKEIREGEAATKEISQWKLRSDEEWMRKFMIDFMTAKSKDDDFPSAGWSKSTAESRQRLAEERRRAEEDKASERLDDGVAQG